MIAASPCTRRVCGTISLVLALGLPVPAAAATVADTASEWSDGESWRTRIVSAVTAAGSRPTLPLGLQVALDDGWHIYWRSPGEAGLPPTLTVGPASENVASVEFVWPAPEQSVEQGQLVTRTYAGNVLIPIRLHVEEPGRPTTLDAGIDYQVCAQV
ncbi:MAG: protein-disulfide reductase DsbD family protein [Rhodospirillales bacterium]|nr:protein-disulfide reductase DsbD family protein [Rhodospirillales bacterium]